MAVNLTKQEILALVHALETLAGYMLEGTVPYLEPQGTDSACILIKVQDKLERELEKLS